VAADSTVDLDNPDVKLNNWYVRDAGKRTNVVTAGGTRLIIPRWDQKTVTFDSLRLGKPLDDVLNPQMIIDWPVTEGGRSSARLLLNFRK
jgi:hypothetical protein